RAVLPGRRRHGADPKRMCRGSPWLTKLPRGNDRQTLRFAKARGASLCESADHRVERASSMDSSASDGDKGAFAPNEDGSKPAEGEAPVVEITGYVTGD